MEFKFDVIDLGVILSALKKYDSLMSREIWDRLKQQYMDQKNIVASVAKEPYVPTYKQPCGDKSHFWKHGSCTHYVYKGPADDGPEVDLICLFKVFPEGTEWPTFGKRGETPLQTTTRLRGEIRGQFNG